MSHLYNTYFAPYIGVLVSALTVVVLGLWNPTFLQVSRGGVRTGCPNYLWLALISFALGMVAAYLSTLMPKM